MKTSLEVCKQIVLEAEHGNWPNGLEDILAGARTALAVPSEHADPAAILGAAMSVHNTFEEYAQANHLNLSEIYGGGDEFMRQCLRVATVFETWACEHVDFEKLNDVWPYLMQDKFGLACLTAVLQQLSTHGLTAFDTTDCLKVAHELQLVIK